MNVSEQKLKQLIAGKRQVLFKIEKSIPTVIYIKIEKEGYVSISLSSGYQNSFYLNPFNGEFGLNENIEDIFDKGQKDSEIIQVLNEAKRHKSNNSITIDSIIALFQ